MKKEMFSALSELETNLIFSKSTANLLYLLPVDDKPISNSINAIANALEMMLERVHESLERAYAADGKED